jgi:phosphomannomutase
MSNTELFGTDGIRARAGEFPLNAEAIVAIGQAVGEKLGGEILIGRDTRLSSPWIFDLMKEGIAKTTAVVRDAGVIPTPAIALLTKEGHFAGGVMISASHNPYEDNGVKVFSSDGTKIDDAAETEIEVEAVACRGARGLRRHRWRNRLRRYRGRDDPGLEPGSGGRFRRCGRRRRIELHRGKLGHGGRPRGR